MNSSRRKYLPAILGALVIVAAVVSVIVFTGGNELPPVPGQASDEERRVSAKVWPAPLLLHVSIDPSQQADQPADVALLDGNMFLVDTGHGRLLEVSADGTSSKALDSQVDPKLTLSTPLGIASGQGQLYVADSGTGRVLLVAPSGAVNRAITLAKGGAADALPPRPIGIVVWGDGSFAVSDANNHRLIKYDADGNLLWQVGTGAPGTGDTAFNVPAGLALDKDGNVYVVDVLNSKVKKYSSDGKFLSSFGELGDGAGEFSRPKAVAVDDAGNIYVSDGLQVAVQVFDQSGTYEGLVGRKDPTDPKSDPLFQVPHGLKIVDGKLYVVDRYAGLFVFDVTGIPLTTSTTAE